MHEPDPVLTQASGPLWGGIIAVAVLAVLVFLALRYVSRSFLDERQQRVVSIGASLAAGLCAAVAFPVW